MDRRREGRLLRTGREDRLWVDGFAQIEYPSLCREGQAIGSPPYIVRSSSFLAFHMAAMCCCMLCVLLLHIMSQIGMRMCRIHLHRQG